MSLIETKMQNLRVNSDLDKNMARPSRYGALDLFVEQSYAAMGSSPTNCVSVFSPPTAAKCKSPSSTTTVK